MSLMHESRLGKPSIASLSLCRSRTLQVSESTNLLLAPALMGVSFHESVSQLSYVANLVVLQSRPTLVYPLF